MQLAYIYEYRANISFCPRSILGIVFVCIMVYRAYYKNKKIKGYTMYEDFNEADIELYGVLKQFLNYEQNRQACLNFAAALAKSVLNKYMFELGTSIMRQLPNNVVSGLKVCTLLLEEPKIQSKLSDFLQQGSVEKANQFVDELNKYIVSHLNKGI